MNLRDNRRGNWPRGMASCSPTTRHFRSPVYHIRARAAAENRRTQSAINKTQR